MAGALLELKIGTTPGTVAAGDDARLPTTAEKTRLSDIQAATGATTAEKLRTLLPEVNEIDDVQLAVAQTIRDVNEIERTIQQGQGATIDQDDIGSVALDARATGRANPTVEGRTATNLVENGDAETSVTSDATSSRIGINLDGTWSFNNNYDGVGDLIINASVGDKIYIRTKLKDGSVGRISTHRLQYSDGSITDGTLVADALLLEDIITVAYALPFNIKMVESTAGLIERDYQIAVNLTSIYGAGNEPSEADCAKIFSYFDGTKSIQLPARVRSVSEDESETSTLYIADNEEVRSFGATTDLVKVVNGEFVLEKNVNDDATAVISPPVITPLLTSGTLQAFKNGTVYFEPYYEGSHQTNASSQITLPYEGTIDNVFGYDDNLDEYELLSSEYSLTGTTLTITGTEENEVFYVEMQRTEPLAPEIEVNVLNNKEVLLNPTNGKYYTEIRGVSGLDGALIPNVTYEEVE